MGLSKKRQPLLRLEEMCINYRMHLSRVLCIQYRPIFTPPQDDYYEAWHGSRLLKTG